MRKILSGKDFFHPTSDHFELRFCGKPVAFKEHWLNRKLFRCGGEKCAACARFNFLLRRSNESGVMDNACREYAPVRRYAINVLNEEFEDYKVYIYSHSVQRQLLELLIKTIHHGERWRFYPVDFDPMRLAFLDAIWDGDFEKTPLIYADWLEDRAGEEDLLLAEAIRLSSDDGHDQRLKEIKISLNKVIPYTINDAFYGINVSVLTSRKTPGSYKSYTLSLKSKKFDGFCNFKKLRTWEAFDLSDFEKLGDNEEIMAEM